MANRATLKLVLIGSGEPEVVTAPEDEIVSTILAKAPAMAIALSPQDKASVFASQEIEQWQQQAATQPVILMYRSSKTYLGVPPAKNVEQAQRWFKDKLGIFFRRCERQKDERYPGYRWLVRRGLWAVSPDLQVDGVAFTDWVTIDGHPTGGNPPQTAPTAPTAPDMAALAAALTPEQATAFLQALLARALAK